MSPNGTKCPLNNITARENGAYNKYQRRVKFLNTCKIFSGYAHLVLVARKILRHNFLRQNVNIFCAKCVNQFIYANKGF